MLYYHKPFLYSTLLAPTLYDVFAANRVDEFDLFLQGCHGRVLHEHDDTNVDTRASCHGTHKVLSRNDAGSPVHYTNILQTCGKCHSDSEYMKGYGPPTDQVEKYNKGYHHSVSVLTRSIATACLLHPSISVAKNVHIHEATENLVDFPMGEWFPNCSRL